MYQKPKLATTVELFESLRNDRFFREVRQRKGASVRSLLNTLVSLTENGRKATLDDLSKITRRPKLVLLEETRNFAEHELIAVSNQIISANETQRMLMSTAAIMADADVRTVGRILTWQEFERLVEICLVSSGYIVTRRLIFKTAKRKYEVDLVASRHREVLCIDCKHWRRTPGPAHIFNMTRIHYERSLALIKSIRNLADRILLSDSNSEIYLLPAILLLNDVDPVCVNSVQVLSIAGLGEFLLEASRFNPKFHYLDVKDIGGNSYP